MIDVALIGYGMATKTFHLPLLATNPHYRITAIVSRSSEPDLSALPHARHYRDSETMLNEAPVDLVVNITPNTLHYPLSAACLRAGKHVVLEKPMTITLQEGQELIALADEHKRLLTVFHNRRLDSDFLTVKKLLNSGRLGAIRTFRSHWDRFRPQVRRCWREDAGPGSGIWYDLGPHLLDQALQLFGLPEAVSAHCRALRPSSPSDDYAHVQLHYGDKEIILHTSPYHCAPNPRFTIEGENGTFVKYGLDPQESQLKSGLTPHDAELGQVPPEEDGMLYHADGRVERIVSERGRFVDFYDNVAAAILEQVPLAVSAQEALTVMRILLLAQESARLGRRLAVNES